MDKEAAQWAPLETRPLTTHSSPSTYQPDDRHEVISPPNATIPISPTSTFRSITQRAKMKTGPQRIADMMFYTLKSYPLMLRRGELPPFIHPRLLSFEFENSDIEPLTNCISLMHIIRSRVQGSRKLFWKNVQLECERLYAEVRRIRDVSSRSLRGS